MSATIQVVNLGIGNVGSVVNMLKRVGTQPELITGPDQLDPNGKLILPGVGSFDAMVDRIDEVGFRSPLIELAENGLPILGVCLGMQLLADNSEEGTKRGLGLIPGSVVRFKFEGNELSRLKIPHMGWNNAAPCRDHGLCRGLEQEARFYFVHSFFYRCEDEADVLFRTNHGVDFASGVQRGNVMGVQFHPEKSHRFGMQLLKNFTEL